MNSFKIKSNDCLEIRRYSRLATLQGRNKVKPAPVHSKQAPQVRDGPLEAPRSRVFPFVRLPALRAFLFA